MNLEGIQKSAKTRELGEGWKHVYNIIIGDDPTFTDLDPKKCSEKYRKLANKTTISSTISSVAHRKQRETELMQEELSCQLKLRKYNSAQSQYNRESRETGGGPQPDFPIEIDGDDLPATYPGHPDLVIP